MLIFEYFSVECIYFFWFFTKLKFMLISLWLQINFNIVSTHYAHIIYVINIIAIFSWFPQKQSKLSPLKGDDAAQST